jgi:hypothetical protein
VKKVELDIFVYVHEFRLQNEVPKMLKKMEAHFQTTNTYCSYILDNLQRVKHGINQGKTPEEIERINSDGLMESLGYKYVDVLDRGNPKGQWREIDVH